MTAALANLNLTNPVLAAPMAGGPSTPGLVIAAARAGTIGFLAGGYKTPEGLAEETNAVHSQTEAFGVNLFAPNPLPRDSLRRRTSDNVSTGQNGCRRGDTRQNPTRGRYHRPLAFGRLTSTSPRNALPDVWRPIPSELPCVGPAPPKRWEGPQVGW